LPFLSEAGWAFEFVGEGKVDVFFDQAPERMGREVVIDEVIFPRELAQVFVVDLRDGNSSGAGMYYQEKITNYIKKKDHIDRIWSYMLVLDF